MHAKTKKTKPAATRVGRNGHKSRATRPVKRPARKLAKVVRNAGGKETVAPQKSVVRTSELENVYDESVLGYQRSRVGAALPWDHERHAVTAVWAKLSQDIGPRDAGRGIRSGL